VSLKRNGGTRSPADAKKKKKGKRRKKRCPRRSIAIPIPALTAFACYYTPEPHACQKKKRSEEVGDVPRQTSRTSHRAPEVIGDANSVEEEKGGEENSKPASSSRRRLPTAQFPFDGRTDSCSSANAVQLKEGGKKKGKSRDQQRQQLGRWRTECRLLRLRRLLASTLAVCPGKKKRGEGKEWRKRSKTSR